ncbi:hypothetical protein, partial [Providencia sp. PROV036]|uniref:hypothetical protein n=1 Tax=Providencia sp. PROV036 TaxID=2949767 RepID=UPI0023495DA9
DLHAHAMFFDLQSKPVAGKHIIDGLKLDIIAKGINLSALGNYAKVIPADSINVNNVEINQIKCDSQKSGSLLIAPNSVSKINIRNVDFTGSSNGNLRVFSSNNEYGVSFNGCVGDILDADDGSTYCDYIDCKINNATGQVYSKNTYRSTYIKSIGDINKLERRFVVPRVPSEEFSKPENCLAHSFQARSPESNQVTLVLKDGINIFTKLLPEQNTAFSTYNYILSVYRNETQFGNFYGTIKFIRNEGAMISVLASVNVSASSGYALSASNLSVVVENGEVVFKVNATAMISVAELVIRDF